MSNLYSNTNSYSPTSSAFIANMTGGNNNTSNINSDINNLLSMLTSETNNYDQTGGDYQDQTGGDYQDQTGGDYQDSINTEYLEHQITELLNKSKEIQQQQSQKGGSSILTPTVIKLGLAAAGLTAAYSLFSSTDTETETCKGDTYGKQTVQLPAQLTKRDTVALNNAKQWLPQQQYQQQYQEPQPQYQQQPQYQPQYQQQYQQPQPQYQQQYQQPRQQYQYQQELYQQEQSREDKNKQFLPITTIPKESSSMNYRSSPANISLTSSEMPNSSSVSATSSDMPMSSLGRVPSGVPMASSKSIPKAPNNNNNYSSATSPERASSRETEFSSTSDFRQDPRATQLIQQQQQPRQQLAPQLGGAGNKEAFEVFGKLIKLVQEKLDITNRKIAMKVASKLQKDVKSKNENIVIGKLYDTSVIHLKSKMSEYKDFLETLTT
jgi:hypothetical protein